MSEARAARVHRSLAQCRHPFLQGTDTIIREHLGLPPGFIIPLTVPHGIDFYHLREPSDVHAVEPLYLGLNDDFARMAAKFKTVLRFPHPWLFLIENLAPDHSRGTLFVAPPPDRQAFSAMVDRIQESEFPEPWGILLKDRGITSDDVQWWTGRGFQAHSAGSPTDPRHFYKLRDVLRRYQSVALPYMSSVGIFAAAMGKQLRLVQNVRLEYVDIGRWSRLVNLQASEVTRVWRNLLSQSGPVSIGQACELLGKQYWDTPERLRDRLLRTIETIERVPVHLYPLKNGSALYRLTIELIARGLPIFRLFPNPIRKLRGRVAQQLRVQKLTVVSGSDFSHYGIVEPVEPLVAKEVFAFQIGRTAVPGRAVSQG